MTMGKSKRPDRWIDGIDPKWPQTCEGGKRSHKHSPLPLDTNGYCHWCETYYCYGCGKEIFVHEKDDVAICNKCGTSMHLGSALTSFQMPSDLIQLRSEIARLTKIVEAGEAVINLSVALARMQKDHLRHIESSCSSCDEYSENLESALAAYKEVK